MPQAQSPMFGGADFISPDAATVKTMVWGKMPKANAGKAFAKPVAITLTAKGSNGKAISGAYANPITLTNSDKTKGSQLLINGKAASSKNTVKKSTDKITLKYTGLAIAPATFAASAKNAKSAKATFAPTLANIAYTGPTVSSLPEVDLTTSTAGQPGYSGNFTATQAGWTGSFGKAFTYAFSAISGQTNNCTGSYSVTPGSGAKATAYTVTAAGSAVAGECLMTMTGGGGKKLAVTLTFTTTSVGINGKHQ